MLGKVPPTKSKGVHFVPGTLRESEFSYEEATGDPWCGRKWNKETKQIEPEVCAYHPMTCWSCNPDVAGWTCKECPDPYSPEYNARISEREALDAVVIEGEPYAVYHHSMYTCRRCKKCNTTYAKVKRYNRSFRRLREWRKMGYHMRFNTFTTRSGDIASKDGVKTCKLLLEDFKAMSRRKAWKHLEGALIVGEIKNRNNGTCHPHLHAITMWSKKPDYTSSNAMLKTEKEGKIHNIDWCYLGDMGAGIKSYIQKYFIKEPVNLGGSDERPRIWITLGLARKSALKSGTKL